MPPDGVHATRVQMAARRILVLTAAELKTIEAAKTLTRTVKHE